jgi:hypothetical protein
MIECGKQKLKGWLWQTLVWHAASPTCTVTLKKSMFGAGGGKGTTAGVEGPWVPFSTVLAGGTVRSITAIVGSMDRDWLSGSKSGATAEDRVVAEDTDEELAEELWLLLESELPNGDGLGRMIHDGSI